MGLDKNNLHLMPLEPSEEHFQKEKAPTLPPFILSLDREKAFVKMAHEALFNTLERVNIPDK